MATDIGNIQEVTRQLTLQIDKEIAAKLSNTKLLKSSRAGTAEFINQVRKRTAAGIKRDGKRFKKYSKSYREFKKNYIKNGVPKKGKRKRKSSTNKRYADLNNATKYRAKKLPNHIRLTGKMFSNMLPLKANIERTRNGIFITLRAYIKGKRNQEIYGYLQEMDRDFWGLSTNEGRQQKEITAITAAMNSVLGIKAL